MLGKMATFKKEAISSLLANPKPHFSVESLGKTAPVRQFFQAACFQLHSKFHRLTLFLWLMGKFASKICTVIKSFSPTDLLFSVHV